MKKLYPFACLLLTTLSFANVASAQNYTAVRSGNWHVASGQNIWDLSGEPPTNCNNCTITIQTGNTVVLNTDIYLSGNSVLAIGDNIGADTKVSIPFSSNAAPATPFPVPSAYHRINLVYGNPATIKLTNSNSFLDASTTGMYDGVFLAVPTPQGNNPYVYIQRAGTSAQYPNSTTLTGVQTLSSNGTLPVILSGFAATLQNGQVELSWSTQIEINADHFAIERSTDGGSSWKTVGTVKAAGNSSSVVDYSYTDAAPAAGVSEYRLEMVDLDRSSTYSSVKVVRTGMVTAISVYPNPAHDYVNVSIGSSENANNSLNIRLLNQSGQLLVEKKVSSAAGTTVSLPVGAYPTGNYLLVVKSSDGTQQVSKVMIAK